ncbi:ADP-ribose pyrophosphatase [Frankia canadensis]|uniref:ADP-ribose pyrophosphatase n=1 Tax=Frankia canadensis TaxID=1836972 RepID=A0A2I2KQM8_9ACTN|nr:NUDIX domain-containing protein [Frankia canadensis]SNQ47973.1 ADP-ribose pyrophosphatase [Frankia canadensis]SOU55263.1 ADP-ribose pyrophosphatase [Frankia canadensis]
MAPSLDDIVARSRKAVAAGCLLRDEAGRVLLVEPTYKPNWDVPGGIAEPGESPRYTAQRELGEELGLELPVGRLLCVDHLAATPRRADALRFLFAVDGPPVQIDALALQTAEIRSARYCTPGEVAARASARLARRIAACLTAPRLPVYLEDGAPTL